jgi:FkbH-like protein
MSRESEKILLLSDFNLGGFAGYLKNALSILPIQAPYGQVIHTLLDENSECWNESYSSALVWTRPEGVIDSFRRALDFYPFEIETVLAEVDRYTEALSKLTQKVSVLMVPSWTLPVSIGGYGMLEMKKGTGLTDLLCRMNLRLSENLEKIPGVYILNAGRWMQMAGKEAYNPKLWYMGKIAFGNDVFKSAVAEVKSTLSGISGSARKIVFVDLDDTLWGGIVGDDGWKNLRLGGHDPTGEAFADFQRVLKSLTRRGILLAIVSKNEEGICWEAIQNHPEMILKKEDFSAWRINWEDKAQNIIEILEELNLGLQSAVFIDDNPIERERVRSALPEVLVPEWPQDKMMYATTLSELTCFNSPQISEEDAQRLQMYREENQRKHLRQSVGTLDEWLRTLDIKVTVESLGDGNRQRATQLLNKTNQMNLCTRRLTESELVDWERDENHHLWLVRVQDKFGDSGLTGIISMEHQGKVGRLVDFLLSCRVMGRCVEESLFYVAIEYARSIHLKKIQIDYIPTEKNKPCLRFLERSGFSPIEEGGKFIVDMSKPYPLPECVDLIVTAG